MASKRSKKKRGGKRTGKKRSGKRTAKKRAAKSKHIPLEVLEKRARRLNSIVTKRGGKI